MQPSFNLHDDLSSSGRSWRGGPSRADRRETAPNDGIIVRNPCRATSVRPPRADPGRRMWTAARGGLRPGCRRGGLPQRSGAHSPPGEVGQGAAGVRSTQGRKAAGRAPARCCGVRTCRTHHGASSPRTRPALEDAGRPAGQGIAALLFAGAQAGEPELLQHACMEARPRGGRRHPGSRAGGEALRALPRARDACPSPLLRLGPAGRRRESIKALAEYLGHYDPGFTLRTYTHLMPSSQARA